MLLSVQWNIIIKLGQQSSSDLIVHISQELSVQICDLTELGLELQLKELLQNFIQELINYFGVAPDGTKPLLELV